MYIKQKTLSFWQRKTNDGTFCWHLIFKQKQTIWGDWLCDDGWHNETVVFIQDFQADRKCSLYLMECDMNFKNNFKVLSRQKWELNEVFLLDRIYLTKKVKKFSGWNFFPKGVGSNVRISNFRYFTFTCHCSLSWINISS